MLNIKDYLCSYEESISMIRDGINRYTRNELFTLVNNEGISSGISQLVRYTFCYSNYDDFGNVYLFDELNPQKITAYILDNPKYQIQQELVYSCVCYAMQRVINEFYKDLAIYEKNGMVRFRYNRKLCVLSEKVYQDKYTRAMDARIVTGYKRIRRTGKQEKSILR